MRLIYATHQAIATALRRFTYTSLNQAAHRALDRAMSEIVDGAASKDLDDPMDDAAVRVVDWAVYDAMSDNSAHTALPDFLAEADPDALCGLFASCTRP